ncbi:putative bifunctional diguanylate cyclase/phosphodiesterase [Actinoplanes friuliensis]|uniref:Signaling protein ykoW n=1 Tax=Actinoplanes friuliensis DSM 7358 TaxID=1246995 RepID=U5W162_9ACTN|nr:EAL domain-containing protein [Actinoplanes friuliensis]AGZ41695.1 Signaling protein ykoW [Actinoplanes friuliensis DSM 7358]
MLLRTAHARFVIGMLVLTAAFYALPEYRMYTWAAIGLSAAAAVLVGVRKHKPSRRLPWWLLAGVLVSFTAGDTTYNILTDHLHQENPFPCLADGFYLASYPLLAAALLIFIRARSGSGNRAALLDALVPTAGLGLLSWVFLIAPYVRDTDLTIMEKLTSVSYPLGDVLALAMLLRLLIAPGRKPLAITVLGAGVSGLLVTDVLYGLRQLAGTWATGGPTDAGWVFFYAAIGVCALHPSMTQLTLDRQTAPVAVHASGRRIALMSFAALIAPVMLLVEDLRNEVHDALVIAVACASMFLLVIARVVDLLRAQREAGARERALREAGALLVAASTEKDAAAALRQAVDDLVPDGEPYRLHFVAEDFFGDTPPPHLAVMVEVASLPESLAAEFAGFEFALHATVLGSGRTATSPARSKQTYLAAAPGRLHSLRPSFDALMAQGAMAIGRIGLTDEVSRRSSEDYFRTLVQSASDVILIVGGDEEIRYASPSAEHVFGRPELVGSPLTGLFAGTDHAELRDLLSRAHLGRGRQDGIDLTAIRADGRLLQVESGCRDLRDDPTVNGYVLTMRDVTERRQLENDLTHQAFHDGLTGLANRVLFQNRLEHAAVRAENDGSTIGVLFVDLDDFKEVNDTLGHAVGDQLLIAVGERITRAIGPLNTAARTGGDEFAVLVEHAAGPDDVDELAGLIVAALGVPVEVGDGAGGTHVVSGNASIGVATTAEAGSTSELQRQADLAMYLAKGEGKNTWQRYRGDLHSGVVERLELRAALNDAAAAGQFVLRYQPIVELGSEDVVGLEALVRWEHPTRGLLGPDQFIDLAEENGSIVAIGNAVLREALRAFVGWREAAPDRPMRYVSVNVSARQFRTPGFVAQVRDALAETGARPEWLLLEITESLVLRDAEKVWADLRELREWGVRIAIDDFGTGYSSLSYLRQMPVDVLKIDKSFIDDILHSDEQLALVEAIVSLARTLKLAVVAEGIEHRDHHDVLLRLGCPYGQGYLFSRPVPPDQVTAWLAPEAVVS